MDAGRRRHRTLAFMNQKGGVGKTTTTVNLGAALAHLGRDVLLIDLDPQAHLTLHVGFDPDELERTIYDLLVDESVTAGDIIVRADENLAVLPSEVNLAGAETELHTQPDRQRLLRRKVGPLADDFDYVLIDCPPSLGLLTLNALALADAVVVPMQAHFLALQGLSQLLETVQLVRGGVNPELAVAGVMLCLHDPQTNLAKEVHADLSDFFQQSREQDVPWRNAKVYDPPIRRNIKLAECPSFGQTVIQYEPWCAGARDYLKLAENLIAEDGGTTTNGPEQTHSSPQAPDPASDDGEATSNAP